MGLILEARSSNLFLLSSFESVAYGKAAMTRVLG